MRRLISISIVCLVFASGKVFSQIEIKGELQRRLEGRRNFREILSIVHSYYTQEQNLLRTTDTIQRKHISRQLKFWNRWTWFNRPRVDEQGNVTNATKKNWNEFEQLQTRLQTTNEDNLSYGQWTAIGPTSYTRIGGGHGGGLGRVNCIAFHPTNANILYVGCAYGGVWRTFNHGSSWTPVSDHIPNTAISGIVISHANPDIVYILTGDGDISFAAPNAVGSFRSSIGVLKSTDGGQTWLPTGAFPGISSDYWGYKLIQDPVNANILFAVTTQGIFRTNNGGQVWTNVQPGNFTDIEFKPGNHNIMYAVSREYANAFYRSTNNGVDWDNGGIAGVPFAIERLAIAVSPNQPNYVYMLAGPRTSSSSFKGVYQSTTEGLSFQLTTDIPNILGGNTNGFDNRDQSFYDHCIAVNPLNAANVIIGGINIWASTNSGANFVNRTHWGEDVTPATQYVHADIHNLDYNPLINFLYACTDGGVSFSADNGVNWFPIWNSLQIMQFYHLTGLDADQTKFIGGTQDNGTNYRKGPSSNYFHVEGADGYSAMIDYSDTSIIYFTGNNDIGRSTDGGVSDNTPIAPIDLDIERSWAMLAMNTLDHNTIYAGYQNAIYKSTNQGQAGSWTQIGNLRSGNIALATCPSNSLRIYAAGDRSYDYTNIYRGANVCWRSDDGGNTWDSLHVKAGFPNAVSTPITDLAVNPSNSNFVWITTGGFVSGQKVFFSTNAGNNWTNISGSLPNVPAISIAADMNGNVYVGTDIGVFYRGAAMGDWIPFYNGLPKTIISDLIINNTTGVVTAATHGRGVFQTSPFSPCVNSVTLSGLVTGNRLYEANSWVSSTQYVFGGTGSELYYKGGDSVVMKPGFEVKEGNFFKAFIGPCASGMPTQSRIYQAYNVTNAKEIIKQELTLISKDLPSVNAQSEIRTSASGDKEIKFSITRDEFVQIYFEDYDHEVLCWLVRSKLRGGQYKMTINDKKFLNGKVQLKIDLDGKSKNILLAE